jgi:DNA-binding GntR family transcriptional regulator
MPIPSAPAARKERSLLRDDVYKQLLNAIVDGTLAPGESLRDAELAEWLGVSRTPIREALLRLGESGLVVASPGRSTAVAVVDPDAVRGARDVVAAMHELAARVTVPNLGPDQLAAMRRANERFAAAIEAGDAAAAVATDDEFHGVLLAAAGNAALTAVLDRYTPVLRRAEILRFLSVDRHSSADRHAEFIELCAAGDAEGAAQLAFQTWHSLPLEDARISGD